MMKEESSIQIKFLANCNVLINYVVAVIRVTYRYRWSPAKTNESIQFKASRIKRYKSGFAQVVSSILLPLVA